ncbi:MAG: Nif3-like dinuclear metal center hexameric protein [Oscillospiraceae bacterium]|nr:Nif3-like dinuclear metal center hexameric protein [Oscillospiraceae bacterium]
MTSVCDIYEYLDHFAPFASQMEFDNSGLQCGDFACAVERAMVCLDVTPRVVEQAARARCELIIAHHPVLFRARKQLPAHDPAWLLARHGMSCIASHTPLDCCSGGVNDLLVRLLGLGEPALLPPLLRLCTLPEPLAAKALAALVSQKLSASVRYCDAERPITTVAICAGEGCHFLEEAYGRADAFLTGDAGHHDFLDAAQHGLALIAAGHFETEITLVPALTQRLRAAFPAVAWQIADEHGVLCHAA